MDIGLLIEKVHTSFMNTRRFPSDEKINACIGKNAEGALLARYAGTVHADKLAETVAARLDQTRKDEIYATLSSPDKTSGIVMPILADLAMAMAEGGSRGIPDLYLLADSSNDFAKSHVSASVDKAYMPRISSAQSYLGKQTVDKKIKMGLSIPKDRELTINNKKVYC